MKKKLALLIGAIMTLIGISGCSDDFKPDDNMNQTTYGPPPTNLHESWQTEK